MTIAGYGLTANILSYGATIQDLRLDGHAQSLVLGFPQLDPYLTEGAYMGAVVGRYANRIGDAKAVIGGRPYRLDANFRDRHLLHGGRDGTGQRNWTIGDSGAEHVTLTDRLPDGHMGFPGNLEVGTTYRILPGPLLEVRITATSDAETLCNFATHGYWNLGGDDIAGHLFQCIADRWTPVDDDLIPTGRVEPVQGPTDWRRPVRLGDRLDDGLIDSNLCLSDQRLALRDVAWLSVPGGPSMTVQTTEPGLQVYAGDHLRPGVPGNDGKPFGRFAGLALEPQIWPDAPNHKGFPDPILRPGQTYEQITRFRFGAEEG
ncbi:aldose epimerase family protein [Paracoccus pacificus]|uniref:Aldose epimerase family protein n=1 Tax=Paracoccus pacificus TaxID=1463598 RepID=A0ABW4R6U8_9RHOB